ncbi:hypothetical protein, partial [uncultured Tateyamaria sp.]|uniref:hypothetical protein n=1 Tax=uncultured Tateyamaria sp. TaxID=455651 RepID=UPI002610D67F
TSSTNTEIESAISSPNKLSFSTTSARSDKCCVLQECPLVKLKPKPWQNQREFCEGYWQAKGALTAVQGPYLALVEYCYREIVWIAASQLSVIK